jgi:hypothetical protein
MGTAVVLVDHIAHDERGRLEPGHESQRCEIGEQREVAVAGFPVREPVAGQRCHLDVDGEEVVAGVDRMESARHLFAPEVAGDPLADEPSLQVGKRNEHGVDATGVDEVVEFVGGEHPPKCHPGSLREVFSRASRSRYPAKQRAKGPSAPSPEATKSGSHEVALRLQRSHYSGVT